MLLRNYDNIVAARSLVGKSSSIGDTSNFGDGYLNIKDIVGGVRLIEGVSSLPMHDLNTHEGNKSASVIVLGSGNTPVTYDDYKLENKLSTSQIVANSSSGVQSTATYDEGTKTWTKSMSHDFQAKSDVTVSEIGVQFTFDSGTKSIVYREVLDTPVFLTTGQYLKVSITTTVSANPNKPADVSATVETVW